LPNRPALYSNVSPSAPRIQLYCADQDLVGSCTLLHLTRQSSTATAPRRIGGEPARVSQSSGSKARYDPRVGREKYSAISECAVDKKLTETTRGDHWCAGGGVVIDADQDPRRVSADGRDRRGCHSVLPAKSKTSSQPQRAPVSFVARLGSDRDWAVQVALALLVSSIRHSADPTL
jgi:hypothetical protein